jgi:cellulose synthase/poly-beta-1,6-N-acetylglucosamine synthase-like glycosyltransferase
MHPNDSGTRAPTVNVIIPTYRGHAHLQETVRSALAQDFHDVEVIVCITSSQTSLQSPPSSYQELSR